MGGAIGQAGKELGLRVTGIRRSGHAATPFDAVLGPDDLDACLPDADFVALATPLTPETLDLMDARRLGLMKQGAGLLNMSRAQVLDHRALAAMLSKGHISGAIIDVVEPEPLPADSPLWETPNLVITPHISSDDSRSYIPRTLDLLFDNIAREREGQPLRNVVDPTLGY